MRYQLSYFGFDKDLTKKTLSYIKNLTYNGYNIDGKDFKGILGAVVYIFSKAQNLRITQSEISSKLGITEVTKNEC